MGLTARMAEKFIELSRVHKFHGDLLTLGRQWVLLTAQDWLALCRNNVMPTRTYRLSYHPTRCELYIRDQDFFKACGFSDVKSCDVSLYEKADYLFDLNDVRTPRLDDYDFILDGSTIEHIFHLPNALANIFRMLKVGGRVLHTSPADGCMDEGFYQLSLCFFHDYYKANNWEIEFSCLYEDEGMRNIVLVRKLVESTCDKMPMQSRYTEKEYWRAGL